MSNSKMHAKYKNCKHNKIKVFLRINQAHTFMYITISDVAYSYQKSVTANKKASECFVPNQASTLRSTYAFKNIKYSG